MADADTAGTGTAGTGTRTGTPGAGREGGPGNEGRPGHEGHLRRGMRLSLLGVLAMVHFGLSGAALKVQLGGYPQAWPVYTAYAVLTLNIALCARYVVRGRPIPAAVAIGGSVATLAASALAGSQVAPRDFVQQAHWSFSEAGWHGVVLLGDRRLAAFGTFLAAHMALTFAELAAAGMPERATAAGMAVTAMLISGLQLAAVKAMSHMSLLARQAGAAAHERERARNDELISALVHGDERERYARFADSAAPVLRGLADGSLDPADEEVRRRCGLEAAKLRRLFAEHDRVADPLTHELRAVIDTAERKGVSVQLAERGTPVPLPPELRRELTDPVLAALAAAERTARVTVVYGENVRVSAVVDAPCPPIPPPGRPDVELSVLAEGTSAWVEAKYTPPLRKPSRNPSEKPSARPSQKSFSETRPS